MLLQLTNVLDLDAILVDIRLLAHIDRLFYGLLVIFTQLLKVKGDLFSSLLIRLRLFSACDIDYLVATLIKASTCSLVETGLQL